MRLGEVSISNLSLFFLYSQQKAAGVAWYYTYQGRVELYNGYTSNFVEKMANHEGTWTEELLEEYRAKFRRNELEAGRYGLGTTTQACNTFFNLS